MTEHNSCVALFSTASEVSCAVKALEKVGFDKNDVFVAGRESLQDFPVIGGLPALAGILSGIGIPIDSIKKYESALSNQQWLVIVQGGTEEVERAAETLATGNEIEVAVHQKCVVCAINDSDVVK